MQLQENNLQISLSEILHQQWDN